MKKFVTFLAILLFFSSTIFFACSKKEEKVPEKGKIDQMTDHAAEVIVDTIKTPIDRARSVKEKEKERAKNIDESLKGIEETFNE